MSPESLCYTIINTPGLSLHSEVQLKQDLVNNDINIKTEALKKVIRLILNGARLSGLIMTVIRFVLPVQDNTIKKLLLIFWEIVPKTTPDGKLCEEMILVCDAYRKDLQHPNEYIRGSTLRFLCKLKEPELLEPLMPAIQSCLEHRHWYVRRNAVLAIFTIYKNFEWLVPDAPKLIGDFLEKQKNASCKRNAFIMLIYADQERALNYLESCIDEINTFGVILQLIIVELIYKVCHNNPTERSRFIRCIYNLLNSKSNAVRYEAAGTLVTLSFAPTSIKAAAICYIDIILKESDNNVKLIVMDRLIALKENEESKKVLENMVMDILQILAAINIQVRRKALELVMDLVNSRNVGDVVTMLQKEVVKTHNSENDDTTTYRQLLVRAMHTCCVEFHDVATSVIPVLLDFLLDENELAAEEVLLFVREAAQNIFWLRKLIIKGLIVAFPEIKLPSIHRTTLWILGEYVDSTPQILEVLLAITKAIGDIPLIEAEKRYLNGDTIEDIKNVYVSKERAPNSVRSKITSDGTYATQSKYMLESTAKINRRPQLRQYFMDGDFFIGATLSATLVKLTVRYIDLEKDIYLQNSLTTKAMLIMSSILLFGKSGLPKQPITNDDTDRIFICLRTLSERTKEAIDVFKSFSGQALGKMFEAQKKEDKRTIETKQKINAEVQPDDAIDFVQLSVGHHYKLFDNIFDISLDKAITEKIPNRFSANSQSNCKLSAIKQLSGFSDPVYVEALIQVNQYHILLDVLVVNQTNDTLQSCMLELSTLGDLKLVERPPAVVLAPHGYCSIKAVVKISSTENGIIFGNIVYDTSINTTVIVLNTIHIDIMDYILPATCSDTEFRKMWQEFEWENKIQVSTPFTDLHEFLQHLIAATNMKCITPQEALSGHCRFLAANLYARSIFGENALANLSLEKPFDDPNSRLIGSIRVRSKSPGMALSLGDKINRTQKYFSQGV